MKTIKLIISNQKTMYFSYIIVKSDIFAMKSIIHRGSDHFKSD